VETHPLIGLNTLKALILAESDNLQWQLVRQLEELGFGSVIAADDWQGFMKAVVAEKPQLVMLSIRSLRLAGEEATKPLEWTLRALELPTLILVEPGEQATRYSLEAHSEYDHYIDVPTRVSELHAQIASMVSDASLRAPAAKAGGDDYADDPAWGDELAAAIADEMGGMDDFDAFMDFPITDSVPELGESEVDQMGTTRFAPSAPPGDESSNPLRVTAPRAVASDVPFNDSLERPPTSRGHRTMDNPVVPEHMDTSGTGGRPTVENDVSAPGSGFDGRRAVSEPRQQIYRTAERLPLESQQRIPVRRDASVSSDNRVTAPNSSITQDPEVAATRQVDAVSEDAVVLDIAKVTLSGIRAGLISGIRVPKVLFGLVSNRATGRLALTQDALQREVLLYRGAIGRVGSDPSLADVNRLLSTFAWETGSYLFDDEPVDPNAFESFGDPMELIWKGIESRLSVDNVMRPLTPYFRSYPVRTTATRMFERSDLLRPVSAAMERLHGERILEQAIVNTGEPPDRSLRMAYFGWMSGALVFNTVPHPDMVVVEYSTDFHSADAEQIENVRRLTDTMTRKRRGSSPSMNLRSGSSNFGSQPDQHAEAPHIKQAREQLERLLHQLTTKPPLHAMGLRAGCGLSEVTSRYYELARQYHPDRFARGYDERVGELAQKVFIEIRTVYDRAQQDEERGTVHAPTAAQSVRTTGSSPAVSAAHNGSPQGVRKVSDILERVRARHATNSGDSPIVDRIASPPPRPPQQSRPATAAAPSSNAISDFSRSGHGTSSRKIPTLSNATGIHGTVASPETLFRNAKRALVAGATAKALELVEQSMRAGLGSPSVIAHEKYLRYALQELSAEAILLDLERAAGGLEAQLPERAQIYVLMGHVYRTEELVEDAIKYYVKAVADDKLNEEANRWARYLRGRAERQEGGFFNKLLSSRLAISPGKK
jgi:hypothetical protein